MSPTHKTSEIAERHLLAWSTQNREELKNLYMAEGIYEDVAANRKAVGLAAIYDFMMEAFKAVPDFKVRMISQFASERALSCEWVMTGTPINQLDDLNATGKSFSVRGASYAELLNNKIARWSDYYDRQILVMQLRS